MPHLVTYEPINVVISGTGVSGKFKLKKHDSNFYDIGTWSLTRILFILSEMAAARYKGWGVGWMLSLLHSPHSLLIHHFH